MQKNIVFGVNEAIAAESTSKKEKEPLSSPHSEAFVQIKQEIDLLKQENQQFAGIIDEMRAQNEELKGKIEQLLSKKGSKKKSNKKMNK